MVLEEQRKTLGDSLRHPKMDPYFVVVVVVENLLVDSHLVAHQSQLPQYCYCCLLFAVAAVEEEELPRSKNHIFDVFGQL